MTIKKGTSTIATSGTVDWGSIEGTLSDQTDLQNALSAKAPSLSPAFTGAPTAPTAPDGTNTTQIATTEFVTSALNNIDALPDQTDMAGKYLATDGINAYWKSPAGLPLLSFIWSDHLLNDASFLRADTFSWHDGTVYSNAYNHLVDDVNGKTASNSDTIGSYTVYYVLADDGHKIVGPDQETTVANIYAESGVAWYYVLDKTNQRFKLPRENPEREVLGQSAPVTSTKTDINNINGFIWSNSGNNLLITNNQGQVIASDLKLIGNTDLSKTTGVYKGKQYLYFYVGNTIKNETEIDVGEITEALNGKLDQDLSNASANFKETIVGWGMPDYSAGVSLINTASYENTITTKGFVLFNAEYTSGNDKAFVKKGSNGTPYQTAACHYYATTYYDGSHDIVPVDVGDIVYNVAGLINMTFFPCKGV